jgi:hypothetical protein
MAVVELLGSTGDGCGLLLGHRSQVTTLFGLSAGEGFGCLWCCFVLALEVWSEFKKLSLLFIYRSGCIL